MDPVLPPKRSFLETISPRVYAGIGLAIICVCAAWLFVESRPVTNFVPNTLVRVNKNMSLSSVGALLQKQNIIRSTYLFRIAVTLSGKTSTVNAGDYFFQTPLSVWQVADRLVHNEQGLTPARVTFPEGTSVRGMSVILPSIFSSSTTGFAFDAKKFAALASTSEGYLFPDTYFFPPNVTADTVVSTMKATFNQRVKTINSQIVASHHSLGDVVIMASILEKEALTDTDRRIVAGVLWKRIADGMPLQIDPPFAYALGKTSDALTTADLQVDSPYNTYRHKGLPPTPINNPGLEALTAAVNASSTPYWFYLSDKKGVMHYAATYEGHLANRAKYLGK
ncbi:MAG: endolytic transglycosylase MltG [bacterium]